MKIYIYILVLISVIYNCSDNKKRNNKNRTFENLEIIGVNLDNMKKISLSEIYSSVKWIKLESNNNNVIGEIVKLEVLKDKFYIQSDNFIDIFTNNGKFINRISNSGRGPGEYISLSDFFVDEKDESILVYDSKSKKIIKYNSEGEFLNEIQTDLDGYSFTKLDDNYAVYIGSAYYNEDSNCRLNILNSKGGIISKHIPIKDNEAKFLHLGDLTNFKKFNNSTSFLYSFNDTIYDLNDKGITPKFFVDFGKDKLPEKYLEKTYNDIREFLESCKKTRFAYRIIGFFETSNAIVFSFMHRYDIIHVYYSKSTKNKFIVNELINDFNFPSLSVPSSFGNLPKTSHGNNLYTIQSAYEFTETIELIKTKLSESEYEVYEKKNPEIISIYEQIDIDSNPLIMIGEIKDF